MRALFLLFPFLELYLLIQAGVAFGALSVAAEIFLSAALGIAVLRFHGRQALFRVRDDLDAGRMPQDVLLGNLLVFFAGILLIFPGLISDCLGLLLLVPPLRALFRVWATSWLVARQASGGFRSGPVFVYRSGGSRGNGFDREPKPEEGGEVIDVTPEPDTTSSRDLPKDKSR